MVNSLLTIVNLGVMGLIIVLGFYYADLDNWTSSRGFFPFGFSGVIAGEKFSILSQFHIMVFFFL